MNLNDLINKLPEADRAKVREYLFAVVNLSIEAAERFIQHYQNGDLRAARKELIQHMTASELDLAMDETNERMKAAGLRVKNEKARTKSFVDYIFRGISTLVITGLMAQINDK